MQPHIVNRLYSLLLIGLGLFGFIGRYLEVGDFQYTALIPAAFGIILLLMTNGVKNENKVIAHVVVVLTLVIGVMISSMVVKNGISTERKSIIFLVIALASFLALAVYVKGFIDKKKQKRAELNQ